MRKNAKKTAILLFLILFAVPAMQKEAYAAESMPLSQEEKEFTSETPVLKVAVYSDRCPASWYDEESNTYKGIAIELMDMLSELTGFSFDYVEIDSDSDSFSTNALLQSDVDLVLPIISRDYYTGAVPVRITDPLYSLSVALAYCDESRLTTEADFTVALTNSNEGIKTMLAAYYPQMKFVRYATSEDCIAAVRSGKADAYGNASYELEYCLKNPRNKDFSIAYSYGCPIDFCIAMREDAPNELYDIINGGIKKLSHDEVERIIRNNSTFVQYQMSFRDKLYVNRYIIAGAAGIVLIVLVASAGHYYTQKKVIRAIAGKEEEARHAAEEAKTANAAKTDFLARMSHDMRTPMNGILGLAELVKNMEISDEARDKVLQIENEGQYLLGLINDILDVSRIEKGSLSLNYQPVDSNKLIADTISLIKCFAEKRNIICRLEQRDIAQGMVLMDKLRIQQIMINVISNAINFSHEGGTIDIIGECYEKLPNKVKDRFIVKDYGIGMSSEFLPRLFEPFEQENSQSIKAGHEGSGLGMTIAKRLIDMLGGRIEVTSEKNVGTTVTIYMDFELCAAEETAEEERTDIENLLSGVRVLLCDDNEVNNIVAAGFLEKAGCEVFCASNGKIGLEMFEASEQGYYKAILMDIRMPVMDGIEATKAIRAIDRADAKNIPIIALTANVFEEDIKTYFAAGMNSVLAKPVSARNLIFEVKKYL